MKKMLKNNVACSSKLFFYFIIIFFVFDILSSISFSWKHSNIPLFFHLNLKNSFFTLPFCSSAGFVLSAPRLCEDRLLCWEFHIETRFNNGSTPLHVVLTPKCEGVGCRTPGHKVDRGLCYFDPWPIDVYRNQLIVWIN